jgi:chromosome segregation ATPase
VTDAGFLTGDRRQGAGDRQEAGADVAAGDYQLDRLAITPATGHAPARVILPLKRYASPRKAVGWLIGLVRRAALRLVFPALDDLANQADEALLQTQARLQQLEEFGQGVVEWGEWVERALRVEAAARESLAQRVEEQLRGVHQAFGDRVDPALKEVVERVELLDSIVRDEERRREERIARVEATTETARNALASSLAAFGRRLESMNADAASTNEAAATHLRELLVRVEALAKTDAELDDRATHFDVALTNLDDGLTARIDQIQAVLTTKRETDTALEERANQLDAALANLDDGLTAQIDQIQAALGLERETDAALEVRANQLDAALANLDNGLNVRIGEVQVALESQHEEVVGGIRIHLEALEASKQEQAARLEQMSGHVSALEAAKLALVEALPRLEDALSSGNERTKDLSERVAEQATAMLELEQAVQAIRAAATTQLDDIRHTLNRTSQRLDEIDALRSEIRELSTIGPAEVESLVEPLRVGLEGAEAALQEQVALLGEQIAALSRESAPREFLDAVAANAARIDRLEEESSAALAAVRRRLQGFPDQPASFHELVDLAERFDRFRAEAFAHVADLAQSLAGQAGGQDVSRVTHLGTEPRRGR